MVCCTSLSSHRSFAHRPVNSAWIRQKTRARLDPRRSGRKVWSESDPLTCDVSSASVSLDKKSASIDGLTLFQLAQHCPDLRHITLSAASFDSPVNGQWRLRKLESLHIEFTDVSHGLDDLLRYAQDLYLQELHIRFTGPGFARLDAKLLSHIHVKDLQLEGFRVVNSHRLARTTGCLSDCTLDLSSFDLAFFYKNAPRLSFERCRMRQSWSWRVWLFILFLVTWVVGTFTLFSFGRIAEAIFLLWLVCIVVKLFNV